MFEARCKAAGQQCSVCGSEPVVAKGYCAKHYARQIANGCPEKLSDFELRVIENRKTGIPDRDGYWLIWVPGSPEAKSRNMRGWAPEHRVVMREKLGRPLRKNENVHHVNGKKNDNRPSNLELWVSSQPSGQRPKDLVAWAREILDLYEGEVRDGRA